jgi:hypothetical protein
MAKKVTNVKHEAGVIKRIYADAQNLDWEYRSQREHTDQYARWLADPCVGGVLSEWMSPEDQRVWLKDGPMKEFARALAGRGPFAEYLTEHPRSPKVVVARLLGDGWQPLAGSDGVKPLRCDASNGTQTICIVWGPAKDFKHLLWAALEAWEESATRSLRIAVFDTVSSPLPRQEQDRLRRIAGRCQVDVAFVRL